MNLKIGITAIILVSLASIWLYQERRKYVNPYSTDDLQLQWNYGATSTVPSLYVWSNYKGKRIECPIMFGGITSPQLRFLDYNGDGKRDIVFESDKLKQVVAFTPANGNSPPTFQVLRNDVTWP